MTEDGAEAVDTEQVSAASDAVVSRETCMISVHVPTVVPKLAEAPQATSEVVQPRRPDYTDLLPLVGECRESLGPDTPDAGESGMEMTGGSPPAEVDISEFPDVLQTARSVTTEVSPKWMEIDTPDIMESGMEVAGGSPPAEVDISEYPDGLLIARSVKTAVSEKCVEVDTPDTVESGMEMASGSPPAQVDISGNPDVLPTARSVMTVVSEKWMERFVLDLDVLCSDGLASGDDPAGGGSDVGSDVCVVPYPRPI